MCIIMFENVTSTAPENLIIKRKKTKEWVFLQHFEHAEMYSYQKSNE